MLTCKCGDRVRCFGCGDWLPRDFIGQDGIDLMRIVHAIIAAWDAGDPSVEIEGARHALRLCTSKGMRRELAGERARLGAFDDARGK